MENDDTRLREVSALREAMARFGKETATIVTLDEEDRIYVAEGAVRVVPAWRWLME